MNTSTPTIYGLCDPETGELRYIGKTVDLGSRIQRHMGRGLKENNYKARWLKTLTKMPKVVVLEETTRDVLSEAERFHIAYFRSLGARLTNLTPGGEGFDSVGAKRARSFMKEGSQLAASRRIVEHCNRTGLRQQNNLKLRKPIIATHLETGEQRWYLSASHAAADGISSRSAISNCLRPGWRWSTNRGWKFEFVNRS